MFPRPILLSGILFLLGSLPSSSLSVEPIPPANPAIANAAWAGVLKDRPRLIGPREHLRALAQEKADVYQTAVKGQISETLEAAGIVHAVEKLAPEKIALHLGHAKEIVARGVTNIHQDTWLGLYEVARVYDYFHDEVSAPERAQLIDWFNAHLGKFTTNEGAFHNSTTGKMLAYLAIAYATAGENPRSSEFRDHALKALYEGKIVPVLLEFGQGGGDTECGWYARGKLWNLAHALEIARRIDGYDGFAKAPRFFYQRLAYEMMEGYPGRWTYGTERFPNEGDGSFTYGSHTEYPRQFRHLVGQYFRGSELARAIEHKRRKASNGPTAVSDFLWEERPTDKPLDISALPLSHFAAGIGHVYARSDWSDDATWFKFNCGDFFAPHQHLDIGNFEIFRREPLATESGEYSHYGDSHAMNWLMRSIAHNVILVHQPDEKWPPMRDGGKTAYANDGGQAWKWEWPADNFPAWKKQQERFERGNVLAYQNTPEFLFVAGDCTKAYAPSKLASWVRQIVFVRPATFVILDRVVSTNAEFAKTWLLHGEKEAVIEGQTSTITNGKGRLVVQTLLPQGAQLRTVEGYTYGGQTFAASKSSQSNVAPKWRLEVQPGAAARSDVFLHVLSTADRAVTPATMINERGQLGVKVGNVNVLFNASVGGTIDIGGRATVLNATVRPGKYE